MQFSLKLLAVCIGSVYFCVFFTGVPKSHSFITTVCDMHSLCYISIFTAFPCCTKKEAFPVLPVCPNSSHDISHCKQGIWGYSQAEQGWGSCSSKLFSLPQTQAWICEQAAWHQPSQAGIEVSLQAYALCRHISLDMRVLEFIWLVY